MATKKVRKVTEIANNIQSTLMLLKKEGVIYPLSTHAFTVAQSSQYELHRYVGALFLYRDGKVKKINAIVRNGYYGNSFSEKIKSVLFGAYNIDTELKEVEISFSELVNTVVDLVLVDSRKEDPVFASENTGELIDKITLANDTSQIFDLLLIPEPKDCLDVF